jgi:hypothetical protein
MVVVVVVFTEEVEVEGWWVVAVAVYFLSVRMSRE